MLIQRTAHLARLQILLNNNPVVGLIGPRQVGKTTLAHAIAKQYKQTSFFDLENPSDIARLSDPILALQSLKGLVIIDEVQHSPELFKILRVLADRNPAPCKFLVLGSASPVLLKQSSESLAGRIAYLEMNGFNLQEVGISQLEPLWIKGGFPRAFLADSASISMDWRMNFIQTFLERDLPQLGINIPAITMRRFWMMLAHYHGQIWNASEFARAFGMTQKTVGHYLDILSSTFIIKQLPPWWENISKRQVKKPKIYLNDSGLLHALLGISNKEILEGHPKIGASWEGFAINAILAQLKVQDNEVFFWSTHGGAELDLLIMRGNKRLGFDFKRTTTPKMTRSLHTAIESLQLTHTYFVHAADTTFPLSNNVTALSLNQILLLDPL